MTTQTTTFHTPLVVGEWVEGTSTGTAEDGTTEWSTRFAGVYRGVRASEHDGTPVHFFEGGYVGETAQGCHAFPVRDDLVSFDLQTAQDRWTPQEPNPVDALVGVRAVAVTSDGDVVEGVIEPPLTGPAATGMFPVLRMDDGRWTRLDGRIALLRESFLQNATDKAWAMVLADIALGVVPSDVDDFGTLHDYVDANMYAIEQVPPYFSWDIDVAEDGESDGADEEWGTALDEVIERVHTLLVQRAAAKATK